MRTLFALALVALPLSAPAYAATATSNERHVEACNAIADSHGVTGYARSSFVQRCFEKQSQNDTPAMHGQRDS